LNLWQPSDDLAEDYVTFKHLNEQLAEVFTKASGKPFDLYGVEHVFWFKGGNPFGGAKPLLLEGEVGTDRQVTAAVEESQALARLPERSLFSAPVQLAQLSGRDPATLAAWTNPFVPAVGNSPNA